MFSHAIANATFSQQSFVPLNYDYTQDYYDYTKLYNDSFILWQSDISNINREAFINPETHFYACNMATRIEEHESFAETWCNRFGGTTYAYEGKTNYAYIMYPQYYFKLNPKYWKISRGIKKKRKKYGFCATGSEYYPIASNGANLKVFSDVGVISDRNCNNMIK